MITNGKGVAREVNSWTGCLLLTAAMLFAIPGTGLLARGAASDEVDLPQAAIASLPHAPVTGAGKATGGSPGAIDRSFGAGGIVTTACPTGSPTRSVILQPDGKIVVVGAGCVLRYTPDGLLDDGFGSGGRGAPGPANFYAFAGALQPDGRIVVAGTASSAFSIVRYNADGSLDTLFGTGGMATTGLADDFEAAVAVALQSDGSIVAAGYRTSPPFDLGVLRYRQDGSLDPGFGSGGIVRSAFGLPGYVNAASVLVQTDGRIVIVGTYVTQYDFALVRYNNDGSLDTGFGSGGLVTTHFPGFLSNATSSVLQPDGKVVVAGAISTGTINTSDLALARYNSDGTLDAGFGSSGRVVTDLFGLDDAANALALQADGRLVAGGYSFRRVKKSEVNQFTLVRYSPWGRLDLTFGNKGKVWTAIGASSFVQSLAVQSDGRIVAVGLTIPDTPIDPEVALARYFP